MKICGFFNSRKNKKLSPKTFRNVFANMIIGCLLIGLFALTYAGGTLNASSTSTNEAIYHGNINSKNISLMINVYWGNEYLDSMLNTLKENNVKTTFFVGG